MGDFVIKNKNKITSEYKVFTPPIGKGAYGEVRKALHLKTNAYRAIKMVSKKDLSMIDKKHILKEITVLRQMDHPHIVKVYEFFETDFYYHIVMEFLEGHELYNTLVGDNFTYNERTICKIMQQLLSAVQFMHNNGIMHRDLKSENIIHNGKHVVIIDFGTSKNISASKKHKQFTGTSLYIAPEVIKGSYTEKCDIWSLGIIMYIMLSGEAPFKGKDNEIFANVLSQNYSIPIEEIPHISELAKDMLKQVLTFDYLKRPSAAELLEHEWFKQLSDTSVGTVRLKAAADNIEKFQFKNKLQEAIYMFLVNTLVDRNEYEDLIELFEEMDVNKDGVLTKQELTAGLQKSGKLFSYQEVDEIFYEIDKDGNGLVSFGEYLAASIDKRKVLNEKRIISVFKLFDKDKSGKISIEEFQEVFQRNNEMLLDNWKEMIQEVDLNGDGEIDFEEFKVLLMKLVKKDIKIQK